MGLNIREIIPRKEIEFSDLRGKTLCVDAYNILYQFLSTVRQPDGTPLMDNQRRITSHLSGLFYRNVALLTEGVKLVYVFDGRPPDLKFKTHERRGEIKAAARQKYETAKSAEDLEGMRKYSMQLVRLTPEMLAESKEILEAMGIPVIQAPGEGEEEAAYLARIKDEVYASASQDYDSLLFGTPRLIRNLTLARRKKNPYGGYTEVRPEMIELDKVLNSLEINRDQLICLGILVGTDYNPRGVPGIGQKKALQLVQKYKLPVLIFKAVQEQIDNLSDEDKFDWKEVFELFHSHNVQDFEIQFKKIDKAKIKEILVDRHDFSGERIGRYLEKLEDLKLKSQQKGLDKWF